jgi:mRNA-degrading endonuclease RelE of RelBE toxin-antitoxin system
MRFRVRYTLEAAAIIKKLAPEVKTAIRRGIDELIKDPLLGKELQEELESFRSHRVRRYRIIYQVNETGPWLDVFYVGPRRDVYQAFSELLLDNRGS